MRETNMKPLSDIQIMRELWQVASRFRWRIAAATFCLLLAKLAVVAVPLVLKRIVDELSRPEHLLVLPAGLLAGYAAMRFASTLFTELRDLAFSRVTQYTVASYALRIFSHLHALGARFHAQRRIGGLLPDIDRGTAGVSFLLGVGLFTIVPTLLEIALVIGIMTARYSGWYTVILGVTFVLYCGYTLAFTARRAVSQRRVNYLDTSAKSLLADSLINYDTVKYFTSEKVESNRFQSIMDNWIEAAVTNQKALFVLHVGQSSIIALGVASVMLLAGRDVLAGAMTVGDLVLINAYVIQICLPLNALGFVYREAKGGWWSLHSAILGVKNTGLELHGFDGAGRFETRIRSYPILEITCVRFGGRYLKAYQHGAPYDYGRRQPMNPLKRKA